ncbi:MAG: hypothetical protein U0457_21030 [Candidatus Sericytochromatia bacterium]
MEIMNPVVGIGTQTTVVPADRIAVSLTQLLSKDLSNVFIGGVKLNLLEIVQNYAIYGIPSDILTNNDAQNNIKGILQELIIKNNLGETVQSFADALKIVSLAIGLNPKYPDGTPPYPFLENNVLNEINRRKQVKRGKKFALTIRGLKDTASIQVFTGSGYKLNVTERNGEYVVVQVGLEVQLGNQNIYLHETNSASGDDVDFKNSLEVLQEDKDWKIRVFNVDDTSYAYINLNGVYKQTYGQESTFDITNIVKDGENEFNLKTYNFLGGYTWGYQILKNDIVVYEEKAGQSGVFGANNDDQSKPNRYVFDKTLKFNSSIINQSGINVRDNLSSFITFESDRDGNNEIYKMNEDGSNQTRLTFTPDIYEYNAKWSPNKDKVLFVGENYTTGDEEVYVMNADGSNLINLTNNPNEDDYAPVWSYDGSKIIYTSEINTKSEIFIMDANGNNKQNITNIPLTRDREPSVSPNGDKIVFRSDRDGNNEIYSMNLDGSNLVNLTQDSASNDTEPKWSPDGNNIIFLSNKANTASTNTNIWIMNPDGTNKRQITFQNDNNAIWSPDGSKIAYNRIFSSSDKDIKIVDLANNNQVKTIINSSSKEVLSDWTNDAGSILYASNRTGNYDIYSIDWASLGVRQLTNNPATDFNATTYNPRKTFGILSSDGRKLKRKF